MGTYSLTLGPTTLRLTPSQVHNLRKMARAKRATGPGGMESVLLTRSELKSLASKGLAWSVSTYKGRVAAYATEMGLRAAAVIAEGERLAASAPMVPR